MGACLPTGRPFFSGRSPSLLESSCEEGYFFSHSLISLSFSYNLTILIDLVSHLQELGDIHSSEPCEFLEFLVDIRSCLSDEGRIYHPLILRGFRIKWRVDLERLTETFTEVARSFFPVLGYIDCFGHIGWFSGSCPQPS